MGEVLTNQKGKRGNVQHIGYLFSHWQYVQYFIVSESDKLFANCRLEAVFANGRRYVSYYESLSAAWDVIHQPIFFGRKYYWFGRGYEVKPANGLWRKPGAG